MALLWSARAGVELGRQRGTGLERVGADLGPERGCLGGGLGGPWGWTAPPSLLFGADFGSPFAFQPQDLRIPGVGVAPAQVLMQMPTRRGMTLMVGSGDHEGSQWAEVRLDGVGPGGVGRREAELDVVPGRPLPDRDALCADRSSRPR